MPWKHDKTKQVVWWLHKLTGLLLLSQYTKTRLESIYWPTYVTLLKHMGILPLSDCLYWTLFSCCPILSQTKQLVRSKQEASWDAKVSWHCIKCISPPVQICMGIILQPAVFPSSLFVTFLLLRISALRLPLKTQTALTTVAKTIPQLRVQDKKSLSCG